VTPERTHATLRAVQERKRSEEKMGAMMLMMVDEKKRGGKKRGTAINESSLVVGISVISCHVFAAASSTRSIPGTPKSG